MVCPWPLKTPRKLLPEDCASLVAVAEPPMGTQLLVESPVLFSQRSAVRFSVFPLKEVPLFTNWATPASCSGVEMSKVVWSASYHEMSAVPSQTVCADTVWAAKPNVNSVSRKNKAFLILNWI